MDGVIYKKNEIEITKTIAKFGDVSYPIANIGAVSIETSQGSNAGMGCSAVLAIAGFAGLFGGTVGSFFVGALVLAAGIGLGYLVNENTKTSTTKLILKTSSGDQMAYSSTDRNLVQSLKSAIETAVSKRI